MWPRGVPLATAVEKQQSWPWVKAPNFRGCGLHHLCQTSFVFWCFSVLCYVCCAVLSRVWLFATPWTVARQAPLSLGFPRQEYWSGLPFPSPGDLPDPGIEPTSPALQTGSLPLSHQESPQLSSVLVTFSSSLLMQEGMTGAGGLFLLTFLSQVWCVGECALIITSTELSRSVWIFPPLFLPFLAG